jgi:hypothetical protein
MRAQGLTGVFRPAKLRDRSKRDNSSIEPVRLVKRPWPPQRLAPKFESVKNSKASKRVKLIKPINFF